MVDGYFLYVRCSLKKKMKVSIRKIERKYIQKEVTRNITPFKMLYGKFFQISARIIF